MSKRFVDHMKNISVPSLVEDLNEMTYYHEILGNIPNSGITLTKDKERFPDEPKLKTMYYNRRGRPPKKPRIELTRDKDGPVWVLVQETSLKGYYMSYKKANSDKEIKKYIDGLEDIKKKLISKLPEEALDNGTIIEYNDIKLDKKIYDRWLNKMKKKYKDVVGDTLNEDYAKWMSQKQRNKQNYNKRIFFTEILNEHFIKPRNLTQHINFLNLINKKIDVVYQIGINNSDPRGGYYYAYERLPNKDGRKLIRREYWDPPTDIFDLDDLNKVYTRYQNPLLPKNNSNEENIQEALNSRGNEIVELGKKIEDKISQTFDEKVYKNTLMLKMWQDNEVNNLKTSTPAFQPDEELSKKLNMLFGIMNENFNVDTTSDISKTKNVNEIWKKDMEDLIKSHDFISPKNVDVNGKTMFKGIEASTFTKQLAQHVNIFLDNIQYFIEVLKHFKDYLIQEHTHSRGHKIFFISNEINISIEEYKYLSSYIDELIQHVLPNMKNKVKETAREEQKKSMDKISEFHAEEISDVNTLHEFEPTGPRLNTTGRNNSIAARTRSSSRSRARQRDDENNNVEDEQGSYDDRRQRQIDANAVVLGEIDNRHEQFLQERRRRDNSERPISYVQSDPKFKYVIKITGTLVLPLIIRHLTMNTLFRRFNPIVVGKESKEIVGIYPSKKMFERIITSFCLKTHLTSNLCLKYFHPDNFIDTATFKEVMQSSIPTIFKDRIRYLSFSYMNATGVGGSDPKSKKTLIKLHEIFKKHSESENKFNLHVLVSDEYEKACMELLDTGIFNELRIKSMEAYKKINTPRKELIGVTYDNGDSIEETLMKYALDSQTYNALLIMTEETIRMWAYKMYWDWALISQGFITTALLPMKMNSKNQLISSTLGAITASQTENIYSFSKSIILNHDKIESRVDNSVSSMVDNSTNFILYGLESGILYFWMNLMNGYMRINVETEDELVKGKTYLYNNNVVRCFDEIRNVVRAQNKLREHVELCQLSFTSKNRGIHIDTSNPKLYIDQERNNSTPIDFGMIGSNRLRTCLYPQGSVVRFRSNGIWRYGIVVDDLGDIWKNNNVLQVEENTFFNDEEYDDSMTSSVKKLYKRMKKKIASGLRGNSRTILYLKRKLNSFDSDENLFDIGTSVVNVAHEYMGEQYRSMINLQILSGIFSLLFIQANNSNIVNILNLIGQVLSGNIFDNISFINLLIPAIIIGSLQYTDNDVIMMQASMLGTALIEYSTKSIEELNQKKLNNLGEYFCVLIPLEMNLVYDEALGRHYIDNGSFWIPTTATTFHINSTYGGTIQYGLKDEDKFNFNTKPSIYLNENKTIKIEFNGEQGRTMEFDRPLFSNTDWSIHNLNPLAMETSTDLIYHPWYYCVFRKH